MKRPTVESGKIDVNSDGTCVNIDEVDEIKGNISTISATLDQSLQVQEALLSAVLNDN